MTFHIRRPMGRNRGGSFYKDRSDRYRGTFCGADPTECDITHREKAVAWKQNEPCADCIAERGQKD